MTSSNLELRASRNYVERTRNDCSYATFTTGVMSTAAASPEPPPTSTGFFTIFHVASRSDWPDGRPVEPYAPGAIASHIQSADLRELSKRRDTIVLLSAAGRHKMKLVRAIVEAGLCNALITDHETACALVGLDRQPDSDDIRPQRLAEHPRPRADDSLDRPGDW